MTPGAPALARAKLNLCLHVTGQRPDGYHLLDSLVVFAGVGDLITVEPSARLSLSLGGPFGADLPADADNLVLKAAALMPGARAAIRLEKNLPPASGIGGGSADAAATLRALAALTGAALPGPEAVLRLGADVPVCLGGRPVRMRGVGERLDPLPELPPMWLVLANPGVSCPTPQVFAALADKRQPGLGGLPERFGGAGDFVAYLRETRNDLEAPAVSLRPAIAEALAAVAATEGCALARMSGSGATVFGLYERPAAALAAAEALRLARPGWWVAAAPMEG